MRTNARKYRINEQAFNRENSNKRRLRRRMPQLRSRALRRSICRRMRRKHRAYRTQSLPGRRADSISGRKPCYRAGGRRLHIAHKERRAVWTDSLRLRLSARHRALLRTRQKDTVRILSDRGERRRLCFRCRCNDMARQKGNISVHAADRAVCRRRCIFLRAARAARLRRGRYRRKICLHLRLDIYIAAHKRDGRGRYIQVGK